MIINKMFRLSKTDIIKYKGIEIKRFLKTEDNMQNLIIYLTFIVP